MTSEGPQLLNAEAASAYLARAVAPRTLLTWAREGRVPCVRFPRRVRFRRADLDTLIERGRREPAEASP